MHYQDVVALMARDRFTERHGVRLWTLRRDAHDAEARVRRHSVGIELVVLVDGTVEWSQQFDPSLVEQLFESASRTQRRLFEADGWRPAGES